MNEAIGKLQKAYPEILTFNITEVGQPPTRVRFKPDTPSEKITEIQEAIQSFDWSEKEDLKPKVVDEITKAATEGNAELFIKLMMLKYKADVTQEDIEAAKPK